MNDPTLIVLFVIKLIQAAAALIGIAIGIGWLVAIAGRARFWMERRLG